MFLSIEVGGFRDGKRGVVVVGVVAPLVGRAEPLALDVGLAEGAPELGAL